MIDKILEVLTEDQKNKLIVSLMGDVSDITTPPVKHEVVEVPQYEFLNQHIESDEDCRRRWTTEEDCFLLKNRYKMTIDEMASHLDRSYSAVATRSFRLGANRTPKKQTRYRKQPTLNRKMWTEIEDDFIKNHHGTARNAWLADKLNRSLKAVESRITTLRNRGQL